MKNYALALTAVIFLFLFSAAGQQRSEVPVVIHTRADAVQNLDRDEGIGVLGQCVKNAADRQDGKAGEKERLASPVVGLASYENSHWNHDELRRDDACRHEQGLDTFIALRELFPEAAGASPHWRNERA